MVSKKIKSTLIIILLVLVSMGGTYLYLTLRTTTSVETTSSTISQNILQIMQFSTLEYNYTDVVSYKESAKYKDFTIPFTEKRFMIKYTGYLKAGSDLSNIEISIPDDETVHVTINHAKITDNVINEEDLYVYDEKGSIFNNLKIADVYDILVMEKEATEAKLIEDGFLKDADERAEELITQLLKAMDFKNVIIRFNP